MPFKIRCGPEVVYLSLEDLPMVRFFVRNERGGGSKSLADTSNKTDPEPIREVFATAE